MKEIVILAPFSMQHRAQLEQAVKGEFLLRFDLQEQELQNAVAVIGQPSPDAICRAPQLQWVQLTWSGAEKYIEVSKQVQVTNARGAFGAAISEYILACVLGLCHNLPAYGAQQRTGVWKKLGSERTLTGKTALIFGAGDIGSCTAHKLTACGMRCIGVRRHTTPIPQDFAQMCTLEQAQSYLPHAQVCICCMPENAQTIGYFTAERFAQLPKGALFVNVGRGSFVDTAALTAALESGQLGGAALDVINPEPLPAEHVLWRMQQVIITPHISGASFGHCAETEQAITTLCCENLQRFAKQQPLKNLIT